jgi:predicted enzyme related to lactoylglutathione lyase
MEGCVFPSNAQTLQATAGARGRDASGQFCARAVNAVHLFQKEDRMVSSAKPRAVGLNHVALEVGDIEEALAFYGRIFEFQLRGKNQTMAFIDLGDQFIALQAGRKQPADDGRHLGLVVDDKEAARAALEAAGVKPIDGPFLDFRDPWGNRIEIVGYDNIQFTKAPNVLRGMGLTQLTKNESAKKELAKKGMAVS